MRNPTLIRNGLGREVKLGNSDYTSDSLVIQITDITNPNRPTSIGVLLGRQQARQLVHAASALINTPVMKVADAPAPKVTRKPTITPQAKTILEHLKREGSISNVEAQAVHKVRALPRRIADLKANGYKITRRFDKDVTGQSYVRYFLQDGASL